MGQLQWNELPEEVRRAVENQLAGQIVRVDAQGDHGTADFAGAVHTKSGSTFVKAVYQDVHNQLRARLEEQRLNKLLPRTAPKLLWRLSSLQWVITGYEYVDGRHARLGPGSGDLSSLVRQLAELAVREVPGSSYFDSLGARWSRESPWHTMVHAPPLGLGVWERRRLLEFADLETYVFDVLASGTCVANGDVSESNVLIGRGGLRIVGWTWATRAPAWVDAAVLAVRLVEAGHSPEQAEGWVSQVPAWKEAASSTLDAFSVALLGLWSANAAFIELIDAARRYASYRLDAASGIRS